MIIQYEYKDNAERQKIMTENNDKIWLAERNIDKGNFLVFTTIYPDFEHIKTAWVNNEIDIKELQYYKDNWRITVEEYNTIYDLKPTQ